MSDAAWLTIIGLSEDGPDGLTPASQAALDVAGIVMGPPRHLELLPEIAARKVEWPVPFLDGLEVLQSFRGQKVVVLASGNPFWFGAGSVIARNFEADEWIAIPGPSIFSLVAARLGWAIEKTNCHGLHAAPLARLRPHLSPQTKLIVLLRDGQSVPEFTDYLCEIGFGESMVHVFEAVAGPNERQTVATAESLPNRDFQHPVCAAVSVLGNGRVMPKTSGIADDWFQSDGQITKQPVRAMTLSALAPKPRETLWDIGGGSGSIGIEWLLSEPTTQAVCIEQNAERAERIKSNAANLGVDRLHIIKGSAPDALANLPKPDAIFIGGGISEPMLSWIVNQASGARLVANGVTLEAEALLSLWHAKLGGSLVRIEISNAKPLGSKRGWQANYPIVQWSVQL
ncbi:MAG: precorrin-6y C5,15-methyltransferase (decarboxylating) subunit CbiE [Boseongicola sp.]|nr:MAG: precorrin-6y C5,15-methyltransferase (decarboxylating) subunit CbiE [Boseongicola sp.]